MLKIFHNSSNKKQEKHSLNFQTPDRINKKQVPTKLLKVTFEKCPKNIYIYRREIKTAQNKWKRKQWGKQNPSLLSFASQKFSSTNDFELTNSCKKSLVYPCSTVLFNLHACRVCAHTLPAKMVRARKGRRHV